MEIVKLYVDKPLDVGCGTDYEHQGGRNLARSIFNFNPKNDQKESSDYGRLAGRLVETIIEHCARVDHQVTFAAILEALRSKDCRMSLATMHEAQRQDLRSDSFRVTEYIVEKNAAEFKNLTDAELNTVVSIAAKKVEAYVTVVC